MRISDWSSDVCSSDLIASGQERVLLAWDRLILPGGRSIRLDRQPGADARGMAGVADRTDHHWGSMLRAALISTLLGVGAELGSDGDDAIVRALRSEEHTSELQSLMRISYAVFCSKKKKTSRHNEKHR